MDPRDDESPVRTNPDARRVRVADVLILTAALALGLVAVGRASDAGGMTVTNLWILWDWARVPSLVQPGLLGAIDGTVDFVSPFLWVMTLALIPLHLASPRRSGSRAGLAAPVATAAALAFTWVRLEIDALAPPMHEPGLVAAWLRAAPLIGFGTLCAWLVLAIGGRPAKKDWVDRCGIAAGLIWIALGLVHPLY